MGFSLAGFGAGLAESMVERIEEERKFSNLALQGRIERASVLKLQQEKQAKEMEEELRGRKAELIQLGVEDPELQKAYLVSPVAFEALKKAKTSTDEQVRSIDPSKLITVNKDKLSKLTGTVDEFISNAVRSQQGVVEPAKLLEPTGKPSFFAPSTESQRTRFGQLAAARGMTLEEVARAESGAGPKMPEPVGSLNVKAFPKEEKKPLGGAAEEEAATGRYLRVLREKGADHPDTKAAEAEAKQLAAARKAIAPELTPNEFDSAKNHSKALTILAQPGKYSPELEKWARDYKRNHEAVKKQYEDSGEKNPNEPNKVSTFQTTLRRAAQDAVSFTFGKKPGWTLVDVVEDGKVVGQRPKYNGQIPQDVFNENVSYVEKKGMLAMAVKAGWIGQDGTVSNPALRGAMANMFEFDGNKVKPLKEPTRDLAVEAKTTPPSVPPATPAASAPARTPGPGRAGQGTPAAAPATPRQLTAEDRQALEWANANPRDPRAAEIRRRLGM